jgi:hypothetical protein
MCIMHQYDINLLLYEGTFVKLRNVRVVNHMHACIALTSPSWICMLEPCYYSRTESLHDGNIYYQEVIRALAVAEDHKQIQPLVRQIVSVFAQGRSSRQHTRVTRFDDADAQDERTALGASIRLPTIWTDASKLRKNGKSSSYIDLYPAANTDGNNRVAKAVPLTKSLVADLYNMSKAAEQSNNAATDGASGINSDIAYNVTAGDTG